MKTAPPHNTPFFFIHDNKLDDIYWCSHPASLHSKNVVRTGQVFVVVYEGNTGGGLYIEADGAHELEGVELEEGLTTHNRLRNKEGRDALNIEYYSGDNPQRMYSAQPIHFYVNYSERDQSGKLIKDVRHEISKLDLLQL